MVRAKVIKHLRLDINGILRNPVDRLWDTDDEASLDGWMATIYLDHNATAPIAPSVIEAMARALAATGNASSVHGAGRAARRLVEGAREGVASALGGDPAGVILTASGSEANALALGGFLGRARLVSAVEHDSVLANAPDATVLPVDVDGLVRLDALDRALEALAGRSALVSVMAANNETGVLQPIAEIARRVHAGDALLHCDATQAFGRGPFDMTSLGVDLVTVSAHKAGGPPGAAALVIRPDLELRALIRGGGQERGRRAGTENAPALAGWGALLAARDDPARWTPVARARDRFEARIVAAGGVVLGAAAPRLPNTSCVAMPGLDAATQVMGFDLAGIAISAGSACSSGKVKSSHVLAAMGVPAAIARSAVRISLGPATTEAEMDRAAEVWLDLARRAARAPT